MVKTSVKFERNLNKTVGGVVYTRYPLSTFIVEMPENDSVKIATINSVKNYLRIKSKPLAHLQSMIKTYEKFHKNQNKTLRGVAHTTYPCPFTFTVKIPDIITNIKYKVKL